jgi:arginine exporter protein ArgO
VAAGVLGVVAAHGLVGGLRRRSGAVAPVGSVPVTGRPLRTLLRFVALTAVNPLTVVYFTVVAAGLTDRLADGGARVAFVLGIGLASAVWQLTLAGVGAVVGARVRPGVRSALVVTGYAVVALLAVALALP